jgi:hypothetical protein
MRLAQRATGGATRRQITSQIRGSLCCLQCGNPEPSVFDTTFFVKTNLFCENELVKTKA